MRARRLALDCVPESLRFAELARGPERTRLEQCLDQRLEPSRRRVHDTRFPALDGSHIDADARGYLTLGEPAATAVPQQTSAERFGWLFASIVCHSACSAPGPAVYRTRHSRPEDRYDCDCNSVVSEPISRPRIAIARR